MDWGGGGEETVLEEDLSFGCNKHKPLYLRELLCAAQ